MLPDNPRRSLPMALLHAREVVMARFRSMLASVLPPSLTRIIKALEGRKFITRNKAEGDGRRVICDDIERRFGHERLKQLPDLLETLIDGESRGSSAR